MTENQKSVYSRKNPLSAKILSKELLTSKIDEKKTWHIEIVIGSGMEFTQEILSNFRKQPDLVNELLKLLNFSNEIVPTPSKIETDLRNALTKDYELPHPIKNY